MESGWTTVLCPECEFQLVPGYDMPSPQVVTYLHFEDGVQTLLASYRGAVSLACVPKEQGRGLPELTVLL